MKLTAMMFWWDEPVERLRKWTDSLAGVADRIVAVDGAFDGFPGGTASSAVDQATVIQERAYKHGIECLIHRPAELWVGQIAKRNKMLDLACAVSDPNDWLLLIEADETISRWTDKAREQLERTILPVAQIEFYTRPGPEPTSNVWETPGEWKYVRRLVRAVPNLRFVTHHWVLWGDVRGDRLLWDGADGVDLDARIDHDSCNTPAKRWNAKRELYAKWEKDKAWRGFEL